MVYRYFSKFDDKSNFQKKKQNRLRLCAFFLILNSDGLFGASEFFIKSSMQRISRPYQMESVSYGISNFHNNFFIAKRNHSHFNDKNKQTPISGLNYNGSLESKKVGSEEDQLEKFESFFRQCKHLFQEIKSGTSSVQQKSVQPCTSFKNTNRKLAVIMPLNSCDSTVSAVDLMQANSSLISVPKQQSRLEQPIKHAEKRKVFLGQKDTQKNHQHVSKTIKKMQDNLVDKIMMSTSQPKDEINQQDLRSILDLYTALVRRPKNSITKVLNCVTDTYQSFVYMEVVKHIESKNSNIDTYRKIYTSLCENFAEDIPKVIHRAVEEMIKERSYIRRKNLAEIDKQNCMFIIAEDSHPLYPVEPDEVKCMLELYESLKHRPKNAVTKVLNHVTNTPESPVYHDVVAHIMQKGSKLETYRNIYARVSKALNKEGIKIIYRIIDGKIDAQDDNTQLIFQKPVFTPPLEPKVLVAPRVHNTIEKRVFEPSLFARKSNDKDTMDYKKNDSMENVFQEKKGKDSELEKEQKRLNRIYGLLPEYHGKSVTGVLLGTTTNKGLSVWNDIQNAIEQIKQEARSEGDNTTIDLDYFKRILLKSQSAGKNSQNGSFFNFSENFHQTNDGKYSISKKEQMRLDQIYKLLANYHGKSITGVLSGATINKSLPVWNDVLNVIEQIQQEARREGDNTTIDLNYFKKIHWSSVRVLGRGGSRGESF